MGYRKEKIIITKYKLIYKLQALKELDKIYTYIKNKFKEPNIAKKTVKNIKGRISNLSYFPMSQKLLRKDRNSEYRKFIIKNYIIIYKINLKEKEVNILHIYNQKQKIKKMNKQKQEQNC